MGSVGLEDGGLQDVPDILLGVQGSHFGGEEPVQNGHGIHQLHPHQLVHHQRVHLDR